MKQAGRKLNTAQIMEQCFGTVATCIDGCYYMFVDRECRSESFVANIQGADSQAITAEDYPYLVSLRKYRLDRYEEPILGCKQHFCGGTLVWYDVVLTAAHCLDDLLENTAGMIKKFRQQVWATRASKCRHLDGIEEVLAFEAIVHPEYDPSTLKNDIAIVFLRGEMSDNFGFINFVNSKGYDTEGLAVIVGYGDTVLESNEMESIPARKASLQLIQKKLCMELMPTNDSVSRSILKYEQMLCAWNNQADTCHGDSGGPLFIQSDKNGTVLIGLSSWGPSTQCRTTVGDQPPSVYVRVSAYVEWILQNIQAYSLNPNYPGNTLTPSSSPTVESQQKSSPVLSGPSPASTPIPIPTPTPPPPPSPSTASPVPTPLSPSVASPVPSSTLAPASPAPSNDMAPFAVSAFPVDSPVPAVPAVPAIRSLPYIPPGPVPVPAAVPYTSIPYIPPGPVPVPTAVPYASYPYTPPGPVPVPYYSNPFQGPAPTSVPYYNNPSYYSNPFQGPTAPTSVPYYSNPFAPTSVPYQDYYYPAPYDAFGNNGFQDYYQGNNGY